jgi:hypothetical protein
MAARIQFVSILASILLLLGVLELVRRRRLMERYALLWLLTAIVILALSCWPGALSQISRAIGVAYPPTALFFVAFVFVLFLLLRFSTAVSRLSDQTKVLAQRVALLEERVRGPEREEPPTDPGRAAEADRPRAEGQRRPFARVSSD